MGKNINELLLTELENLEKDPESRRAATNALKSYVKDLDTKFIPVFLARASEIKDPASSSGECIITLFDILVRNHGCDIVPHINTIMETIIKTLSSSLGSFALHQSCSKVVPAIARYGIDPLMSEGEKARIVCSICKPLSNLLMGSQESAASGSALCLRALVESDNWRFASDSMVNEVCLKVAGALEETQTQTTNHMGLVMALLQHNPLIIDAYSRSLIRSGLQILTPEMKERNNSQRRLSAIQMINFMMKFVDSRSISSEIDKIVDIMEKSQNDSMLYVKGAAFEAYQTAKNLARKNGSLQEMCLSQFVISDSHSNFSKRNNRDELPIVSSPLSVGQSSSNVIYSEGGARRLWNNGSLENEFGNQSVSSSNSSLVNSLGMRNGELSETQMEHLVASSRSTPASPQISRTELDDDVKMYSTPRKLNGYIQSSSNAIFEDYERQNSRMITSPDSTEFEQNHAIMLNKTNNSQNSNQAVEENVEYEDEDNLQIVKIHRRGCGKTFFVFFSCILMVFIAFILSNMCSDNNEAGFDVVPT